MKGSRCAIATDLSAVVSADLSGRSLSGAGVITLDSLDRLDGFGKGQRDRFGGIHI
jgi:hypothetical protein